MFLKKITTTNYRTLCDFSLEFSDYYTAICGKNNAGKSNVIRAINAAFEFSQMPEYFYDRPQFSHESDTPIWLREKQPQGPMSIILDFELDEDRDKGLVEFIGKMSGFAPKSTGQPTTLTLEVSLPPSHKKPTRTIHINGQKVEEFEADEVHKKLQTSGLLLLHDSAQSPRPWYRQPYLMGVLSSASGDEKQKLEKKQKEFTNSLKRAVAKHREDLGQLIGRLGEKYQVSLSAPEIRVDQLAFELALDDRGAPIALEDWGSGTRNTTLILKTLFDARMRLEHATTSGRYVPIVIIEEPEAFLHPAAQAKFANVLQDLSDEFEIQVITTTHSPYLLSHRSASSNVLLSRELGARGVVLGTKRVPNEEAEWWKPFELALGVSASDLAYLKNAIFSQSQDILLVEGESDARYLRMCMDEAHGKNRFAFFGELYPYGGFGFLTNNSLLKFIRNRFPRVIVTYDLDVEKKVLRNLESAGFTKGVDCFPVGKDRPGAKSIEGLLPDQVVAKVAQMDPHSTLALTSADEEERKAAKDRFKQLCLEIFEADSTPGNEWYSGLYELTSKLTKAMDSLTKAATKASSSPFSGSS